MYARTTTVQADPSKIDDGIANVRDEVTPVITGIDGDRVNDWLTAVAGE